MLITQVQICLCMVADVSMLLILEVVLSIVKDEERQNTPRPVTLDFRTYKIWEWFC